MITSRLLTISLDNQHCSLYHRAVGDPALAGFVRIIGLFKPAIVSDQQSGLRESLPDLFSLCMTKSAQQDLVIRMVKPHNTQGICVGLVIVGGKVAPDEEWLIPTNIAERTSELVNRDRDRWDTEAEVVEKWFGMDRWYLIEQAPWAGLLL